MARLSDPAAEPRLLAAAEEAFVEHGLDRARVEDITARAGLSKGAFYLHFDSKEGVFRRLVETTVAELAAHVEAALREGDDDDVLSIEELFERRLRREAELFAFLWERRGCMRLLLEGGRSPAFMPLMDEFADRARWRIMGTLRWGVERGMFRDDLDLELASLYVAGAYDRLARHVVRQADPPDFIALVRGLQRFVLGGVANEHVVRELDGRAPMPSQVTFR